MAGLQVQFAYGTKAGYETLEKKQGVVYFVTDAPAIYLNGVKYTCTDVYAKAITDAIEALDTENDVITASVENDVVTLKTGVKEIDGIISATSDTITLAKVAKTGKAEDLTITTIEGVTGTNAQAALESLKNLIDDAGEAGAVSLDVAETATTGYLKTYVLSQGTGDDKQEIGKIDIPKDYLVKSGSVVKNPEGQPEGTYIELVLNVKDGAADESKIYINVAGLVDIYKGAENASEVQITVTDYVISAAVVDIDASKITYIAADATADPAVARESVKAALTRLDGADTVTGSVSKKIKDAIDALNADLDAELKSTDTDDEALAVVTGVTEVAGKLTAVDSAAADKAGAATRAKEAVIGTAGDAKTADTIKGVKNFIGSIPEDAEADTIVGYIDEKTGEGVSALNGDATIATNTNGVVTIKGGVKETEGIIDNDEDAPDITLAKVATTGASEDVKFGTDSTVKAELEKIEGDATTAGSIAKAQADVIGTNTDDKDDDTVYGAKAYAKDAVETALTWGTF